METSAIINEFLLPTFSKVHHEEASSSGNEISVINSSGLRAVLRFPTMNSCRGITRSMLVLLILTSASNAKRTGIKSSEDTAAAMFPPTVAMFLIAGPPYRPATRLKAS
jgi:hypothetical protein